ncbi:protein of unknown function [Methanoculleus bourgensis]|uniref:Uncharacterized protein n=1 Tax=Methanoculleus bourgensis TaxID=83986 RepID=A0A0X3BP96_9EURY|nr:protein of unknown function [Methanoculleus bourgensis]
MWKRTLQEGIGKFEANLSRSQFLRNLNPYSKGF